MKRSKIPWLRPLAVAAVGVFLGRGAQADTTLTFDSRPAGQTHNEQIIDTFGDNAAASSDGVLVTGSGTPNIGLTWSGPGGGGRWDFYIDAVWSAGQLHDSALGTSHSILFTPDSGWAVNLKSFNFHPYYVSTEMFDYTWSVLDVDGSTVLTSGSLSFGSDAKKNHPVEINYTGNVDQALTLSLLRNGGDGGAFNIAIDDLTFAQVPEPSAMALLSLAGIAGLGWVVGRHRRRKK